MDLKDIYWLAGIIEGEGYIASHNARYKLKDGTYTYRKTPSPTIVICMTDRDVIERVSRLTNQRMSGPYKRTFNGKDCKETFTVSLRGKKALEWSQTVYTLMGQRRQKQIETMLSEVCHRP